jgi:hypothetical protein
MFCSPLIVVKKRCENVAMHNYLLKPGWSLPIEFRYSNNYRIKNNGVLDYNNGVPASVDVRGNSCASLPSVAGLTSLASLHC